MSHEVENMKHLPLITLIAAAALLMTVGCGSSSGDDQAVRTEFSLIVEELSGPTGTVELALESARHAGGTDVLLIVREGAVEGASVLIEFDPGSVHPAAVEAGNGLVEQDLFLGIEDRNGEVPIAFHRLEGRVLKRGDVAARIRFADGTGRGLAITSPGPPPVNLAIEPAGDFFLAYDETNPGDFNSDGTVSGIDIFPLALHFGHTSDYEGETATDEFDNCIDGNQDGQVNGLDVFVIASNFGHRIDEFNVYSREHPGDSWTFSVTEPRVDPDYPNDCFGHYSSDVLDPTADYIEYMARTYDDDSGTEGDDSEIVSWGDPPPVITSIDVTPTSVEIEIDEQIPFSATAHWSEGPDTDITGLADWVCADDGDIASFTTPSGTLEGLSAGQTTIWCEYMGEMSNIVPVDVSSGEPTLLSIDCEPVDTTVTVGGFRQFTGTANWDDASQTDVTDLAVWHCLDEGTLATFSGDPGLLEGLAEGLTEVWCTYQEMDSKHSDVEVSELTLLYITVTPNSANVEEGATRQFTATARWSDFSDTDVTDEATWVSENEDLAAFTVTPGLLEGIDVGELDIWCTYLGEESTHSSVTVTAAGTGVIVTIEEEEAYSAPDSKYQFRGGSAEPEDVDLDADYWDFTDMGHAGHSFKKYYDMDYWEMDQWRDQFPPIADRFFRQSDPDSGYSHTMEPRFCNTTLSQLEIFGMVLVEQGGEGYVQEFSPAVEVPYPFFEGYTAFLQWDWYVWDVPYPATQTITGVKQGTVKTHMGEFECLLLRTYLHVDLGIQTVEDLTYQWLGHDGSLLAQTSSPNFNEITWEYTGPMDMLVEEPYDP
jgi:hypothetical protein